MSHSEFKAIGVQDGHSQSGGPVVDVLDELLVADSARRVVALLLSEIRVFTEQDHVLARQVDALVLQSTPFMPL